MNAIERKLKQLKEAGSRESIKESMKEVLRDNLGEFADANVEQLMEGEDADGKKIIPKYSNPMYAAYKAGKNSRAGRGTPDLKLSGDFHEGINAKLVNAGVHMHGSDFKTPKLVKKYGRILGVQANKLQEIKDKVLKPYLQDKIKKKLR